MLFNTGKDPLPGHELPEGSPTYGNVPHSSSGSRAPREPGSGRIAHSRQLLRSFIVNSDIKLHIKYRELAKKEPESDDKVARYDRDLAKYRDRLRKLPNEDEVKQRDTEKLLKLLQTK